MEELRKFINKMREQGLTDEIIYKNLLQSDWSDQVLARAFLPEDAIIPTPSEKEAAVEKTEFNPLQTERLRNEESPDTGMTSKAESVFHHIFLWVFSVAFITNVEIIISTIISGKISEDFSKVVATSIAALTVTGVAYWMFYFRFVKEFKKRSRLQFSNGWATTTVVLMSLSLGGSILGLITSLIWNGNLESFLHFIPVIIYSAVVLYNYSQINFSKKPVEKRRPVIEIWYTVIILGILSTSIIAAGLFYFDRKSDFEMRQNLTESARKISGYYWSNGRLPNKLSEVTDVRGVEYKINGVYQENNRFELCGNFKYPDNERRSRGNYHYYSPGKYRSGDIIIGSRKDGENIDMAKIEVSSPGKKCFKFNILDKSKAAPKVIDRGSVRIRYK